MVDFLKFKWLYFLISFIVIASGIISVIKWGYTFSIDFVGGTNLEYKINKKINLDEIKKIAGSEKISIVEINQKNDVLTMHTKAIEDNLQTKLKSEIEKKFNVKIAIQKSETVGPVLGRETMVKTLIASLFAIVGILIYMSFSFKGFNFALSAILAMLHDFLVVMGSYSLMSRFFGAEVDTMFVTAVLTSMSFSVHDTIIIFDKIREYHNYEGKAEIEFSANKALTETMVRSLNNSMTIIFMLLALTLMGGTTIRFFVATLLIGTITGTYSSPFIATPILVWLEGRKKKKHS
ncbi:MAG: protein translocase subunit SecF [bacterium]|nr:protein translocase subunit SecF [bacterium]